MNRKNKQSDREILGEILMILKNYESVSCSCPALYEGLQ